MTFTQHDFARAAAAADAAHTAWMISPDVRARYNHHEAAFVSDAINAALPSPPEPELLALADRVEMLA